MPEANLSISLSDIQEGSVHHLIMSVVNKPRKLIRDDTAPGFTQ
jgi:hypothetical protein